MSSLSQTRVAAISDADIQRDRADLAMDRYARGDDQAFGALYDAIAPRLVAYLRRHTRDAAHVEDVVQATLLQMHRARGSFILGAPVAPWAFAIARRLLIDDFRRQKRVPPLAFGEDALLEAVAPEATPEARAEASQLALALESALEKLPEGQRVAFRLLRIEGSSVAEAAELLGTSEGSVKLRAHRAYEALRDALEKHRQGKPRGGRWSSLLARWRS
ncbi:MAG: RNA polymerase sigma factor [Myxococcota bacterium]